MKRLAIHLGVRPQDILVDNAGLNTQATVRNTGPLLSGIPAARVAIVSHFYHLPRIKLAYWGMGCEVFTVPARENPLFLHPYNMVREIAAFWLYYLRSLASGRVANATTLAFGSDVGPMLDNGHGSTNTPLYTRVFRVGPSPRR
jgi:hypothetical protein